MQNYEKKAVFRDYPVNHEFGDDESFFRVITESGEVLLPKLPFQKDKPLPDTISCRIKGYNGDKLVLGHNMSRYVSEFYADGASKGKDFVFKVISLPDDKNGFYRLVDDNGLTFRLQETKMMLSKGQSVKCKFEVLDSSYFKLRRSETDELLPMLTLRDIVRVAGVHGVNVAKLDQFLHDIPELEMAIDELSHGRPVWVLTAFRALKQAATRLFRASISRYPTAMIQDVINGYRNVLLYLLEGSNFMRSIKGQERTDMQRECTQQLEQLDTYTRTLSIISQHKQKTFIDAMLTNLKASGYLYHPTTQFAIMMHLFQLSPELVNSSLGNIFDALMGWDASTWTAEPFRSAFVDQFEIYIDDARDEINSYLQPQTQEDTEKIEKVLTAIAIQNELALPTDDIDMRRNRSNFYRYLSLLRTGKADSLLNKSYLTLLGANLPTDYTWSDIKEPTMMMTRASVDPPANAAIESSPRYYYFNDIEVEIGNEGIIITKTSEDAVNAVSNGILQWPGVKINVGIKKGLTPSKLKSIDGHAEFWSNIETALLRDNTITDTVTIRRKADIDDVVRIVIDKVIPSASDYNRIEAFHCRIVDEHFDEGEGYLKAEDIVNYNLHAVTVGTFRFDDGSQMMFDATVIDIDENDRYHFSLIESTRAAIADLTGIDDTSYCVITKDNGSCYSAISERGYGLYLEKDKDGPGFHRGNIVVATIVAKDGYALRGMIDDGPIDTYNFSNARALHNLMLDIAIHPDSTADNDIELDEEDALSRDELREVIEIMRYKAVALSDDIVAAYDYLSLAHLLAIIIDDPQLINITTAHRDILMQCQHYAKNKKVFISDVQAIKDMAPDSILVQRLSDRLMIIAALGELDQNPALWDIVNNSQNDLDCELARNVLSYNLLYEHDPDDQAINAIKDRIARKLNVSSEQRNLKYYGSESQYVEFKSSLVYPAGKGRKGISVADPDVQEHEILHIIASFLNADGGTLYIGVSDDGYERGLDEDFKYYTLDRSNNFRHKIRSADNMANYLQNLIDKAYNIGKIAGDYAKVFVDTEATKSVLAVKVNPCPRIVLLDDELFVRHGVMTQLLQKKEEIDTFVADRDMTYRILNAEQQDEADSADSPVSDSPAAGAPTASTAVVAEVQAPEKETVVATSAARRNILHEWDDADFVQPAFYLRFTGDDEYVVTNDEYQIDETADRLDLAVRDDETDGYLVLAYDDETAVKVRMADIMSKSRNMPHRHYNGRRMVFACPVKADGALYSMHTSGKGTIFERATPVSDIPSGSMKSEPSRILAAEVESTPMYEYIAPERIKLFTNLISTGMKRSQIGVLAKGEDKVLNSVAEVRENLLRILK